VARDFKKIKAWQHADEMVIEIYRNTKYFPKEELYGLTSQLRRAAVSVPANIAEGSNREHKKEYLNFLYIAQGSIAEVEYLLHLSKRIGYLKEKEYQEIEGIRIQTAKTLFGLIKYISEPESKAVS
jgi:four helix bundle protein